MHEGTGFKTGQRAPRLGERAHRVIRRAHRLGQYGISLA